jgi:hypothetical protein
MNTVAKKKLTIMLDAEVYAGLQKKVGGRGIGAYLSKLARPHVIADLDSQYKCMAKDLEREKEAQAWIDDVGETEGENLWQF